MRRQKISILEKLSTAKNESKTMAVQNTIRKERAKEI